jgi:hypothetical protein
MPFGSQARSVDDATPHDCPRSPTTGRNRKTVQILSIAEYVILRAGSNYGTLEWVIMFLSDGMHSRPAPESDAVYMEIVGTLYGTLLPILCTGIGHAIVGAITVQQTGDPAMALLTSAGSRSRSSAPGVSWPTAAGPPDSRRFAEPKPPDGSGATRSAVRSPD